MNEIVWLQREIKTIESIGTYWICGEVVAIMRDLLFIPLWGFYNGVCNI